MNPNDIAALREEYRRLRTAELREFGYKGHDRTPITEEDEREFDNSARFMPSEK